MRFGDRPAGKALVNRTGDGSTRPARGRLRSDAVRPPLSDRRALDPSVEADGHRDVAEPVDKPRVGRAAAGGAIRLGATEGSVPHGRRWLRDQLGKRFGHDHPAVADTLQVFSEVLTNAVLHGAGRHVRIVWRPVEHGVMVEVYNDLAEGRSLPDKSGPADAYAESGRGLVLVEAYSDAWGTARTPGRGIKVWFSMRLA